MNIKNRLYKHCLDYITKKMDTCLSAMNAAQEAANAEEKSSAGDKYETGRAMMQREKEKYSGMLAEYSKIHKLLLQIDVNQEFTDVRAGALVHTNRGYYFVAISADEVLIDDVEYDTISLLSPLGKALRNSSVGDICNFRGETIEINSIK